MTPPGRTHQTDLFAANTAASSARAQRMGSIEAEAWPDDTTPPLRLLVGFDEAGRGPLAGPVSVAAVALSPQLLRQQPRPAWLAAVDDSKKLSDARREALFPQLIASADAWAIAHVHADHIDAVNILQATFHGMALVAEALFGRAEDAAWNDRPAPLDLRRVADADAQTAWYADELTPALPPQGAHLLASQRTLEPSRPLLLIDGNARFHVAGAAIAGLPQRPIIKGDSLSFHIAAASILAKVSRDHLMIHADTLWPGYGLAGHKGYPTAAHKAALAAIGAAPIHRRTFGGVPS